MSRKAVAFTLFRHPVEKGAKLLKLDYLLQMKTLSPFLPTLTPSRPPLFLLDNPHWRNAEAIKFRGVYVRENVREKKLKKLPSRNRIIFYH